MVDTIKLTLGKNMFLITDVSLFQKEKQNASRGYFTLVQNSTKSELLRGIYKPRLTMTKRFNTSGVFEATLSIELSLPNFLFGNNFDELIQSDFQTLVDKLIPILKEMGVRVFTQTLINTPVSSIHYSKNIPLTDGSIPYYYISKIKETNISLALDINQTDYKNEGHGYKWHCNSYEVAFYDKIKDLEKARISEKRATENDNALQLHLFDELQKRKRFEVLRMEVRLNTRPKIKWMLKTLGIETELTFKGLFNSATSQKVLLYYINELQRQRLAIIDFKPKSPKDLLATLTINNPKLGLRKILQLFGLKQAFEAVNPRELRTMFGKYTNRSWQRLIAEVNQVNVPKTKNPFTLLTEHLNTFEPLKLVDFQSEMINNDKYN